MLTGKYTGLILGEEPTGLDYSKPFKTPSEKWLNLSIDRILERTKDSNVREKLEELKIGLIKLIETKIASKYYEDRDILIIFLQKTIFPQISNTIKSIIPTTESKEYASFIELSHDLKSYEDEVINYVKDTERRFKC